MDHMDILNSGQILDLYDNMGLSVAVIDRDLKIIYRNQAAQRLYSKLFGEREYLGYSTRNCHSGVNQKNIDALFLMFAMGKPLNYYHGHFPAAEGGEITAMQLPYYVNGNVEGMIEVLVESNLADNGAGRGAQRRVFEEK